MHLMAEGGRPQSWRLSAFVFGVLFLWLAVPVTTHDVFAWERNVTAFVTSWEAPGLRPLLEGLSLFGRAVVVVPLAVAMAILNRRRWGGFAWTFALVAAAAPLVEEGLKWLIARPRPSGLGYGFPSGHAFLATVLVGLGEVALLRATRSTTARAMGALAGLSVLLAVVSGRVYVGAHWPADVLGGVLAGAAYLSTGMWLLSPDVGARMGPRAAGDVCSAGDNRGDADRDRALGSGDERLASPLSGGRSTTPASGPLIGLTRGDRYRSASAANVRALVLVGSGVLGALAFPTTGWFLMAWVWLTPALVIAVTASTRRALVAGWLAGGVFFMVLLRWLEETVRSYSAIPWPLTWLPIAALASYCGFYTGAVTAAVAWLRSGFGSGWALTAAPLLWVGAEWTRGSILTGFPWGLLGYSQHSQLAVIQVAELTGVYGVSFLLVAVNAALAGVVTLGSRAITGVVATAGLLSAVLIFGVVRLGIEDQRQGNGPDIRIAVIQPSIEQLTKWDPRRQEEALRVHEQLTRQAVRSRPAVVLWPETAVAGVLPEDPAILARLGALAGEVGTPLLVGSLDRTAGDPPELVNSAFLLSGAGIQARYDKMHLVPFGEYVPFPRLLGFLRDWAAFISEFTAGRAPVVFPLRRAPFGTVICYEAIFPELFRAFVARGATFMANISNDAWFGRTSGPWQHLSMLPLRAVEHRIAIARAANTGISAFIEPTGRVARVLPLFQVGVLEGRMAVRQRTTPYTRYGDWFAYGCLALAAGSLGFRCGAPVGACGGCGVEASPAARE